MTTLAEWLRQRRFPPEFRIGVPQAYATAGSDRTEPEPDEAADLPDDVVADIATDVWRARRKLGDGRDLDGTSAQRQAVRHVRSVWERLTDAGVVVQEHEGTRYDVGLVLDVLAYQDDPDVVEEVVIETVRPSVFRDGRCIQVGEVIVAQPERGHGDGT